MDEKAMSALLARITVVPGMTGGRPVTRRQRFTVSNVSELLASNTSHEATVEEHPLLESEDIQASLLYAALQLNTTRIPPSA